MKYAFAAALLVVSADAAQSAFQKFGGALSEWNVGIMTALQEDMTNTTTDCYSASMTAKPNVYAIFDTSKYTGGAFNTSDFINNAQFASLSWMSVVDSCNFTSCVVLLDSMFNDLFKLGGSASNLATQLVEGASDSSTPVYKAYDGLKLRFNGLNNGKTNW